MTSLPISATVMDLHALLLEQPDDTAPITVGHVPASGTSPDLIQINRLVAPEPLHRHDWRVEWSICTRPREERRELWCSVRAPLRADSATPVCVQVKTVIDALDRISLHSLMTSMLRAADVALYRSSGLREPEGDLSRCGWFLLGDYATLTGLAWR